MWAWLHPHAVAAVWDLTLNVSYMKVTEGTMYTVEAMGALPTMSTIKLSIKSGQVQDFVTFGDGDCFLIKDMKDKLWEYHIVKPLGYQKICLN